MKHLRFKKAAGILSLISIIILVLSLFFIAVGLAIVIDDFEGDWIFLFYPAGLYLFIFSIQMILKPKLRGRTIRTSFRVLIMNLAIIAFEGWAIYQVLSYPYENDIHEIFLALAIIPYTSPFVIGLFVPPILSFLSVIFNLFFLIPYLKDTATYIKEEIKDSIKNPDKIYVHEEEVRNLDKERSLPINIKNDDTTKYDFNTSSKIYEHALKYYRTNELNKALKYFKQIPNYQDSFVYIIEIEEKLNKN